MAGLEDLLQQIPFDSVAGQLGVDSDTARQLTEQALPALMAGMGANAADAAGAESLTKALQQHSPDLVTGGIDLNQVDVADGEKIVDHVFGDNTPEVMSALGSQGGGGDLMRKLLPMLAPLVMSFLAQQMAGRSAGAAGATSAAPAGATMPGAGLEDLLGGLLGGSGGSGGGGSIMDVLGGLLGGGKR